MFKTYYVFYGGPVTLPTIKELIDVYSRHVDLVQNMHAWNRDPYFSWKNGGWNFMVVNATSN